MTESKKGKEVTFKLSGDKLRYLLQLRHQREEATGEPQPLVSVLKHFLKEAAQEGERKKKEREGITYSIRCVDCGEEVDLGNSFMFRIDEEFRSTIVMGQPFLNGVSALEFIKENVDAALEFIKAHKGHQLEATENCEVIAEGVLGEEEATTLGLLKD